MRTVLILEAERNYRETLGSAVAFVGHRPIAVGATPEARIVLELEPVACIIVGTAPEAHDEASLLEELRRGPASGQPRILVAGQAPMGAEHVVRRFDRTGLLSSLSKLLGTARTRRLLASA